MGKQRGGRAALRPGGRRALRDQGGRAGRGTADRLGRPAYPGGQARTRAGSRRRAGRARRRECGPVATPPVDEIATALHILVPIRSWLHDPGWRQFVRLLVIPYGLLPLVFIALFASSSNLSTPGWAYSLYIAPLWAIVFWLLIRPGPVGRQEIGIAAGSIVFALIWIRIVTVNINGLMGKARQAAVVLRRHRRGHQRGDHQGAAHLAGRDPAAADAPDQARRADVDVPGHAGRAWPSA